MILHFFVHEQTITALETTSVPRYGSRGYLRLAFEFDESWDAFPAANGGRTVYLQKGEISAPIVLDEIGCVEVDDYFTATDDGFMLMLVGINGTVACPTNVLSISLEPSGEAWTAEPPDLDLPAYQQLVLLAQQAVAAAEEARKLSYCLPVARGMSKDGAAYVATGENLPDVKPGSNGTHAGKGKQIIFIPDHSSNTLESPTLQINGGDAVPIRMRAPKNQGQDESRPDATLPVPVGALMVGVPYTLTFCGKYWLVDSQIAEEAAKDVAVTDFNITRGSGHYTATWKDAGTQKSANIVGGVGLAQVTEILSYDISTRLPKLLKSKLVGAPTYSVMIGDLIVYTGADFTVSVPSEEAGGVAKVTIAERNEVFRVVTVTEGGSENEGYIVERTGLILKDSQIRATLDGTDVATVRDALTYLQDLAKQYVVNMTKNADGTYTADKTFAELKAAHDAGKTVICSFQDLTQQWDGPVRLPLVYLGNTYMGFAAVVDQEQGNMVYLWAYINSGGMGHTATEIATNDGSLVHYTAENKTDAQKTQARANIGAEAAPVELTWNKDTHPAVLDFLRTIESPGRYTFADNSGKYLYTLIRAYGGGLYEWYGILISFSGEETSIETKVYTGNDVGVLSPEDYYTPITRGALNNRVPETTAADAGKVLTVGAGGFPAWTAVVNAEEVAV